MLASIGSLQTILGIFSHSWWNICSGMAYLLMACSFWIIPQVFYCEVSTSCLRQQELWRKKEIAWQEVRLIGNFGFTDSLAIYFGHQIEDYGYIIVNAQDREQFISAMRQYAPKAEFKL